MANTFTRRLPSFPGPGWDAAASQPRSATSGRRPQDMPATLGRPQRAYTAGATRHALLLLLFSFWVMPCASRAIGGAEFRPEGLDGLSRRLQSGSHCVDCFHGAESCMALCGQTDPQCCEQYAPSPPGAHSHSPHSHSPHTHHPHTPHSHSPHTHHPHTPHASTAPQNLPDITMRLPEALLSGGSHA